MFNRGSQSRNILTLVDRKSRFLMLTINETKKSEVVIDAMSRLIEKHGAESITLDNGAEFTNHSYITSKYSIPTYFCDPGAPWQKGSVENMNKLLRRFIPFELEAHKINQDKLDQIADILNNMPRASLGFLTPFEMHESIDLETIISESRVKLARPATEAIVVDNMK